ncbi:MAG: flagellar motor protein MotB [Deltaproteobacteria bacterium]|jgi:chemotaxis protein MotB|nr:flagellar motor protein MotB [Deltaproteobacteria bacterium]MCW8894046.1 flagellar motor protein MotB [Deltaproteobacteria bacterium]MCW9048723.1 flagellar motor protein MotB [Deltaproteobacteria bacterium]
MEKKHKCPPKGAPMWMVTFSDMVTLLLTFFVLMLSMASMDKVKFDQASDSLAGAFGVLGSSDKTEVSSPKVVSFSPVNDDFTAQVYRRLRTKLRELKLNKEVKLVKDRGAVVLRVDEAILFESNQTRLQPESDPILRKVAELVRPLPLNVKIEGHTDDRGDELANWDLSVARSIAVLRFMAANQLIPLTRMSATGYGSQKPLFPNASDRERALNRRVEFVLESQGDPNQDLPYLLDAKEQSPF